MKAVNKNVVLSSSKWHTMHMLFPFSSVCESFICFLPSGVVSLEIRVTGKQGK